MRRALLCVAGVACAAALTACGAMRNTIQPTASRASPLSLELAGPADADQVGVLAARTDGAMTRAGVDLSVRTPTTPSRPLADVEAGRVDVAVVPEPQLMIARDRGAYVLGWGALVQRPRDAIIALRSSHIRSVADLKGRTVGTTGLSYETGVLDAMLEHAHVASGSVRRVDVGADLAGALTSHRVAATFGGSDLELAAALRRDHRRIEVVPPSTANVPPYGDLVFVSTETFFAKHLNLLRRFTQAVGRGYAAVRADPAAGIQALQGAEPSLAAPLAAETVRAALPAFFPGGGRPWGWQDQSQWNAFGRWMQNRRLLRAAPAWYLASTNQLLAGQGP